MPQWAAHLERHQLAFVSKGKMCCQSSGWIYMPDSLWLQMHLTELTDSKQNSENHLAQRCIVVVFVNGDERIVLILVLCSLSKI